jgi:hypothetical protein
MLKICGKVACQKRYILLTLPQRRHFYRKDVEAVEQLARNSFDVFFEIPVGGGMTRTSTFCVWSAHFKFRSCNTAVAAGSCGSHRFVRKIVPMG